MARPFRPTQRRSHDSVSSSAARIDRGSLLHRCHRGLSVGQHPDPRTRRLLRRHRRCIDGRRGSGARPGASHRRDAAAAQPRRPRPARRTHPRRQPHRLHQPGPGRRAAPADRQPGAGRGAAPDGRRLSQHHGGVQSPRDHRRRQRRQREGRVPHHAAPLRQRRAARLREHHRCAGAGRARQHRDVGARAAQREQLPHDVARVHPRRGDTLCYSRRPLADRLPADLQRLVDGARGQRHARDHFRRQPRPDPG